MKKLDKYVLISLGFKEHIVPTEESGAEPFIYYSKNLDEWTCLITNSYNLPVSGDEIFTVNLFNHETLGICYTDEEVRILWKALTRKDLK